ncbi:hypothetical protein AJ79_07683 [Helicocarpus griseus UAMH5409]|uniref:Protein BFR2 n=1 Tax=Helicocarpus griseus UAMH5409 TaxID=1447875 RepID=A0A2B7WS70_9EURO|nr:hypothetical protein AJ79_07683 [Helicocarpus griseus UAMH5409]
MAKKSGQVKSLAEQIAELEDPTPKDFDPEDLSNRGGSSDDESAGDDNAAAAREHYEAVGKSKLRKPEKITLGKEYAGSKVSRKALEDDESEDDPFRKASSDEDSDEGAEGLGELEDGLEIGEEGSDAEIDSEEALGESDVDRFKEFTFRGSKTTRPTGLDAGSEGDEGSDDELDGVSGSEEDEGFGDSDEDEDEDEETGAAPSDDRAEIRRLMASDHKTVAATLSQAAKTDAAKGSAVKRQRSTFGAILNARIKLQKGITTLNNIPSASEDDSSIDEDSIKSAEAAALALWSTIEDLRHALADAHTKSATPSKKRKRGLPPSAATSSTDIWDRMEEIEAQSRPHRRAVLDKWAQKTRGSRAALPNARGKLLNHGATEQQTITTVLDAHVATQNEERSSKRHFTEEHAQQANGHTPSTEIYDDSMFYQTLLRDLVEERMAATNNGVEALQMQLPARLSIHPTTGMRKDKVKRAVDTKASKGRKMRYTVHEKLQNFMAPENRGTWGDRAKEEFFASLLGRSARGVLGEDDDEVMEDEEEENVEESGLKLFRN